MSFTWEWSRNQIDEKRLKTAQKTKLQNILLDEPSGICSAQCAGSAEAPYTVSLQSCSCVDFHQNLHGAKPCKHILRLAMDAGIINQDGLTPTEAFDKDYWEQKMQLAAAFGAYYLFDDPILSDKEYDSLKQTFKQLFLDTDYHSPTIAVSMQK